MKIRETLIGLAVLGSVLVGFLWSRGGDEAAVDASVSSFPDLSESDRTVVADGIPLDISVTRPVTAFVPFRVSVRTNAASDRRLTGGRLSFAMSMPMGDHRYDLVAGPDGWQQADVTLPACLSGERRWYGTVDGRVDGRAVTVHFVLDLSSRETAPAR